VLVLPAELTHGQARACCGMLAQALRSEPGREAVADASALRHFDSSALAVLLECRREALVLGKHFSVSHLHPRLRALATLYGVGDLLPETV
jgi:phospholipid transport system transporter-binding protein